jgi:hypothetical protein
VEHRLERNVDFLLGVFINNYAQVYKLKLLVQDAKVFILKAGWKNGPSKLRTTCPLPSSPSSMPAVASQITPRNKTTPIPQQKQYRRPILPGLTNPPKHVPCHPSLLNLFSGQSSSSQISIYVTWGNGVYADWRVVRVVPHSAARERASCCTAALEEL